MMRYSVEEMLGLSGSLMPSEFAKEERLYGVLTGYGHEDIMLRPDES